MKKFLRNVGLFILLLVVSAFVFDYLISFTLKQSHEYAGEYEVMNDIYNENINCDVAVYGSSRALVHIDPNVIQDSLKFSAYNFGIDGHGFWLQYLRHLEFIKYNKQPKIIIISTDAYSLEKKEDLFQQNQFLPYMLWNENIKNYTSSFNGFKSIDYFIPLIRYFGKKSVLKSCLMVLTNKNNEVYRDKGYKSVEREWGNDFELARNSMSNYKVHVDRGSIKLFEKFVQECKALKIKLVLVNTPEYFETQNFVSNRDDVVMIYENLAIKYDLLFFDYSKSDICKNKDFFYNATHLNSIGSNLFSKILVSDIKNDREVASVGLN